jgi:hypothetical protein
LRIRLRHNLPQLTLSGFNDPLFFYFSAPRGVSI